MKKNIILGVTSGIAAFKILDLARNLRKLGFIVNVMMTEKATHIIKPNEFESITGNKVYRQLFEKDFDYKKIIRDRKVNHIELADNADIIVIAPATANIIAKIANGVADDFLTTTILATQAPVIIFPSMNVHMWENPIVQNNLNLLKKYGYKIVEPSSGPLACGYEGKGRLPDIKMIQKIIEEELNINDSLKDKKILVTSGGTIEKIDEVRFITNRSSGKMGVALAQECKRRGAEVLLLRSSRSATPLSNIDNIDYATADDLLKIIKKELPKFDVIFHTAAVSDFKVENAPTGKLSSNKSQSLKLLPRKKILDEIKKINPKIKLISFKAEYGLSDKKLIEKTNIRLNESNSDAMVANDVSTNKSGFESDNNEVIIITKTGYKKILLDSKINIAKKIVNFLIKKRILVS